MNRPDNSVYINGKYRIIKELGHGAFGSVFLAEHEVFGVPIRTIALKMFETRIKNNIHAREIFNDALILTKMLDRTENDYIKSIFVRIYDIDSFSTDDGKGRAVTKGYMAMELMEKDLRSIVGNPGSSDFRKTSVTQALDYMKPVIDGLAYMHNQDPPILHRDLKPDNILFKYRSGIQIKIADFGLAVQTFNGPDRVKAAGTLSYQDYESFSLGNASTQSDVYAVGVIFYELLTGKYPIDFDYSIMAQPDEDAKRIGLANLRIALKKSIAKPSLFNVELGNHTWLENIIMKCLTPYREDRIQSAVELKQLIENRNGISSGKTLNEKYDDAIKKAKSIMAREGPEAAEAEKLLQDALAWMPERCSAPVLLAQLYTQIDQTGKAEEILIRRVEKEWICPHLYEALALVWEKRNNPVMRDRYKKQARSMKNCNFR